LALVGTISIEINDFDVVGPSRHLVDVRGKAKNAVGKSKKASQFCRSDRVDLVPQVRRDDEEDFIRRHCLTLLRKSDEQRVTGLLRPIDVVFE
jgi:hypothetical protein